MIEAKRFIIVEMRILHLVKAYSTDRRYWLARYMDDSSPDGVRPVHAPSMCRTSAEKVELRMALFGYTGFHLILTYAPEFLPQTLEQAERDWRAFLRKLTRWRVARGLPKLFEYIVRIEGQDPSKPYGYHIHAFLDGLDFQPILARAFWDKGEAETVLYDKRRIVSQGGYRQLAEYFCKERPQVGKHRFGCSRGLAQMVPPARVRYSDSGTIPVPRSATRLPIKQHKISEWGQFSYAHYLID